MYVFFIHILIAGFTKGKNSIFLFTFEKLSFSNFNFAIKLIIAAAFGLMRWTHEKQTNKFFGHIKIYRNGFLLRSAAYLIQQQSTVDSLFYKRT